MTGHCGCGSKARAAVAIPITQSGCSGAFRPFIAWSIHWPQSCRDWLSSSLARRVFATAYTLDSRFVLSGSDDANLRIWKAHASEKLGVVDKREQVRKEYRDGLREKWGTVGDVAKVERTRYLPKPIHKASELKREMLEARRTKEEHRIRHAPRGVDKELLKPKPARKAPIAKVEQ
jgi:WD repeat and SOF domain-containing protein 1